MQQKPKQSNKKIVQEITQSMITAGRHDILSDILGSYTGTAQGGEAPEQDADDL
jgi:hypothetical protein